jgi:AcrR family transcriptional regulator
MRPVDERVRLKKEGGRYHHGNLKDALVLAAERSIAKSGNVDLPLRDVAKLAGVSHAAAYRHFDSKAALLAEVAARGFKALEERLREAAGRGRALDARLVEVGVAYVGFALESVGAFRVMFEPSLKPLDRFPQLAEASFNALAVFHGVVQEAVAAKVLRSDDVSGTVMAVWALVHGHACLLVDGHLAGPFELGPDDAAASARLVVRRLVDGLRER